MRRAVWLVALGGLWLASAAQAHVSLHPNTLPAGSFPTINLHAPNEEAKASMSKLAVQFPPGFLDVSTGYLPGWRSRVITEKLAQPVKTDQGTVTEQVREVVWSGGKIPPGSFLDFPLSTSPPEGDAGKTLTFKVVQTYDNGKKARWIGPPDSDQPAPTVNITPKGGVVQDVAGTEAGPGSAQAATPAAAATTKQSKGASKGLGVAALVVAIAALLAALGALALAIGRRSRGRSAR
jgi:uncharacterized protein YcnI